MQRTQLIRLRALTVLGVFFVFIFHFAASCDDAGSSGATGGVVGFKTGVQHDGEIPSDGTEEGSPDVGDLEMSTTDIAQGEPLEPTIDFSDAEGDVATVNFAIEGEGSYYTLDVSDTTGGAASGEITLQLYLKKHVPGFYTFQVSLTDAQDHVSAHKEIDFAILEKDGSRPDTDDGKSDGDTDTGKDHTGPAKFVVGYVGESGGDKKLVQISAEDGNPTSFTHVYPEGMSRMNIDYQNGHMAMRTPNDEFNDEDHFPIAYLHASNPSSVTMATIPPIREPEKYYWVADALSPRILSDGRVVVGITEETHNWDDLYANGQLGVWDPKTDTFEIQGSLTPLILAQPEVSACNPGCDIEQGTRSGHFAVSPDDRYVYFYALGYGVDLAMFHNGDGFIGRWDLETGESEILANMGADGCNIWAVSADGKKVLFTQYLQWKVLDVASRTISEFGLDQGEHLRTGFDIATGQVRGDTMISSWRGCEAGKYGGIVSYDFSSGSTTHILDGEALEVDWNASGITDNVQLGHDKKRAYFAASDDWCANYSAGFTVVEVPLEARTKKAVDYFHLDKTYAYSVFLLL